MNTVVTSDHFDGPLAEYLAEVLPSDEIKGGAVLGWFGLYRNRELPGGAILHRDSEGFVTAWYSPSEARLDGGWREIRIAVKALRPDHAA